MKSEGFLIAERALAQHSDQLAVAEPKPEELIAGLTAAVPRIQRALGEELPELLGGERPEITCTKVEKAAAQKLHKIIDAVAANYLLEDASGAQMLVSLDLTSALILTDQVFGGPGNAPAQMPERLPAATDLTLSRFTSVLCAALGAGLERPDPLTLAARSDVLGKLVPARDPETFFVIRCQIEQEDRKPWELVLALRQSQAAALLSEAGAAPAPTIKNAPGDRRRHDTAPFSKMPMPLTAVLAEMKMPVSVIANIKAGDTLPLVISAQVPLRLGGIEIARGQVGAADGCLAVRLTKIAWSKSSGKQKENPHVG